MPLSKKRQASKAAAEKEKEEWKADAPEDEDDELAQPAKALRSKYGRELRNVFRAVLNLIDGSALPYFKDQVVNAREALDDFIVWLFATHRSADDFVVPDDAPVEEEAAPEEEEEEVYDEEEEVQESEEDEELADELEEQYSEEEEYELDEDEESL